MWLTDESISKSFFVIIASSRILSTCSMPARQNCEASTWRHDAHFATVVRGCCCGCRCRSDAPEVGAAGTASAMPSSSLLLLLLLSSTRGCMGLRMSADRMADCTQKLQTTISAAAIESWQTGFNSFAYRSARLIFSWADRPTDVQRVAICLIWCRVVQSRDVMSRVFSRPILTAIGYIGLLSVFWSTSYASAHKHCLQCFVYITEDAFRRHFVTRININVRVTAKSFACVNTHLSAFLKRRYIRVRLPAQHDTSQLCSWLWQWKCPDMRPSISFRSLSPVRPPQPISITDECSN